VRVEDGRVASIGGSRVNPVTEGFICGKVRRFTKRLYGPDRLLHPLRRKGAKGGGEFARVSWDEALDEIAQRMDAARRESGGESILPYYYGGSNGLLTMGAADTWLFRSLGTSRLATTVCAAPTGAAAKALYGKMASVDLADFGAARFILIWGANPRDSNIHLVPNLKRARQAGARIAVVDPRRTMGEGTCDFHLPVYPGTDVVVALAMIGHLERIGRVDRTFLETHATGSERLLESARAWTLEKAAALSRIEARLIATVAEAYAEAEPALVRCGWGLERNRNGEAAAAAVLALPAVAGKFGVKGGGYALSGSGAYRVNDQTLAGQPEPGTRLINMNRLGRVLLEETSPPVKVLFVYNANPVATVPDQNRILRGLRREDLFTVVFDQVMTDTARFADVVLPATTFLEHVELSKSYGSYGVFLGEPVIEPVGESRPNEAVFLDLARRLRVAGDYPKGDPLLLRAMASMEGPVEGRGPEDRLRRLREGRILRMDFPGERPIQFGNVLPRTTDKKAHLWPEELGAEPYRYRPEEAEAAYPLALISPATDRTISSSLAEYGFKEAFLHMHPDDAGRRRLSEGDTVRVHNALGEVVVRLRLDRDIRPGVVNLPKGIWNRHTKNGAVGNALVSDAVSEVSGGACFNDARVEVSRV
jgi:anaerobic selenocysteine-containing dehydrogenase